MARKSSRARSRSRASKARRNNRSRKRSKTKAARAVLDDYDGDVEKLREAEPWITAQPS